MLLHQDIGMRKLRRVSGCSTRRHNLRQEHFFDLYLRAPIDIILSQRDSCPVHD